MTRFALLGLLTIPALACDDDDNSGSGTEGSTSTTTGDATSTTTSTSSTSTTTTSGGETTTTDGGSSSDSGGESGSSSGDAGSSSSGGGTEGESSTGAAADLPDIDMTHPDVISDTQSSVFIDTQNFSAQSCAVVDGCVFGTGERRLLRFDTITPNLGTADFHVGNATDNPDLFIYSECSGSFLFNDYAHYRLLDADGKQVGQGHKNAFALIDLSPFSDDAGPSQYGFNGNMGISVGWADIYGAGLSCQWVDITDVPPGDYTLELAINEEQVVEESTFDNNILQLPVSIPAP